MAITSTLSACRFVHTLDGENVVLQLFHGTNASKRAIPTSEWVLAAPRAGGPLSVLFSAAEDTAANNESGITVAEDAVCLPPSFVAGLSASDAAGLGLPAPTPLALDLKSRGLIPDQGFRVENRWIRPGGTPVLVKVRGAFIESVAGVRRIPEPLYSIWRAARRLEKPLPEAERFAAIANLRAAMPEDARTPVEANAYLADTRINYASSVSLSLARTDAFDFDPVLFSEKSTEDAEGANRPLDEQDDRLLTAAAQKLFVENRFRREKTARPIYILRDGEYVYIDPALQPVLNEIRQLQEAPKEERRAFLSNPRLVLRERLGEETAERLNVESRFVETEQFSERVAGVDVWRTPVLPWIKPGKNSWLPESFGLRVGEQMFVVKPEHAQALHERVETAADAGAPTAHVSDLLQSGPGEVSPPEVLPINPQVRQAVASLAALSKGEPRLEAGAQNQNSLVEKRPPERVQSQFLVIRENLEEVEFTHLGADVPANLEFEKSLEPPAVLRTPLKPHQQEGFAWFVRAYSSGKPGVLLADDMGLGKTLQAMTFMALLQAAAREGTIESLPFLIVAPTGLLHNWREEIERHLVAPRLGELIFAFGSQLSLLREEGFSGNDIQNGRAGLDSRNWTQAGAVLTTYETLRDYHFSFARTRFGLVVFDEIQKLKNPASQVTRAAKTLNTRFAVGMTGTPIENRLQDIWSIMDVVSPGLLGSSRDFEKRYRADSPDQLKSLKQFLTAPVGGGPPLMLRRMKADHLPGLPKKHSHAKQLPMPPKQAEAYGALVNRAIASRSFVSPRQGMLPLLHEMRGVSLHPVDPSDAPADLEAYARDSARLSWTLEVLDTIATKREKALIFVESLAMQERLATLLQSRYRLPTPPMRINGSVPGHKRQELVNRFQSRPSAFDAMILSPKAGGVGLNLTAANHVIHLSRWWNPAVEDQSTDRCFRIGQEKDVHVYLPIAVHTDPLIGPSSFDLKLDALLEKKRRLSRDMLAPPEGDDSDISELFDAVSLAPQKEEQPPPAQRRSFSAAEDVTAQTEQPAAPPAKRSTLSISTPLRAEPVVRTFIAEKGQPRPLDDIAKLFASRRIEHVEISDPFALAHDEARTAQVRFLEALAKHAQALEAATFIYDPEAGESSEGNQIYEVRTKMAVAFSSKKLPKLAFRSKRRGRRGAEDFHDREVEISCLSSAGKRETHTIWTGRGLISLTDRNWVLRLTYRGPVSGGIVL